MEFVYWIAIKTYSLSVTDKLGIFILIIIFIGSSAFWTIGYITNWVPLLQWYPIWDVQV